MRNIRDLQIIVACDKTGGISKNGEIPWNFKEDWQWFKTVTDNSICIMGRKTYDDIVARKRNKEFKTLLPNRESYVISSKPEDYFKGIAGVATSVRSIMEDLDTHDTRNVFLLGGAALYIQNVVWANTIYMTGIDNDYECDKFFPIDYVNKNFKMIDGKIDNGLYFGIYKRVR